MKRIIAYTLLLLMTIQLCACQANPDNPSVVSKNDGVFESNIHQSATDGENSEKNIQSFDVFYSTDESIEFSMRIQQELYYDSMPVVEVVPYSPTEDDVKRVAQVLFGDAVFYERDQSSNPTYSKAQIQTNISRWSEYANATKISTLYFDSDTDPTYDLDLLKYFIEYLTEKYENAPEENPDSKCNWQYKKERHYNDTEREINGRRESDDADVIYAYTEYNDVEYIVTATKHDQTNYVSNGISISLQSSFGLHWDKAIWQAEWCRTEKPTEEQVNVLREKAEDILDQIQVGNWSVIHDYVQIDYYGDTPEYTIVIDAVPEINGVPAIWGQDIDSMTDEDTVASNYPMSRVQFIFSPEGNLLSFEMTSPITTKEIINENVLTLSFDSLIETGKTHLSLSDAGACYGIPAGSGLLEMYEDAFNENIICKITISEIEYALARTNKSDSENSFYYTPAIVFKGVADYYGEDSGVLFFSSSDYYNEPTINLVIINAVDGTIIEG